MESEWRIKSSPPFINDSFEILDPFSLNEEEVETDPQEYTLEGSFTPVGSSTPVFAGADENGEKSLETRSTRDKRTAGPSPETVTRVQGALESGSELQVAAVSMDIEVPITVKPLIVSLGRPMGAAATRRRRKRRRDRRPRPSINDIAIILHQIDENKRIGAEATLMLLDRAEHFMTELLTKAVDCCRHRKRKTLDSQDLRLALRISNAEYQ